MAPRKDATAPTPSASQTQQDASSEGIEDFELPKVLITQLARSAIPKDAKLDDDTITALVKGSTVFITHLASTAQEIAASRAHKTISSTDILRALDILEFGELVPAFQGEVEVFRQANKVKSKAEKDKEMNSPARSLKPETTQLEAADLINVNDLKDTRGPPEVDANGGLAMDVEMEVPDECELAPVHDVKFAFPVE